MHVGHIIYVRVVIDVRYVCDIHRSVRHVHVLYVARAGAIRRNVNFARPQGEPRHSAAAPSERNSDAESGSANECDECGSIDGPHDYRARYPAPASSDSSPSAVMEGREAPRFILDPCPAPRRDPGPVSISIGSPVRGNPRRKPHGSVVGNASPLAVIIQIFVADHVTRDVACGRRALVPDISGPAPIVEVLGTFGTPNVKPQRVRTGNARILAGVQMEVAAASRGLASSLTHGNVGVL